MNCADCSGPAHVIRYDVVLCARCARHRMQNPCQRWGTGEMQCILRLDHLGACHTERGDAMFEALKDLDVLTNYVRERR